MGFVTKTKTSNSNQAQNGQGFDHLTMSYIKYMSILLCDHKSQCYSR